MTQKLFRQQWMKWHGQYEKYSRIVFQRLFKQIARTIPLQQLTEENYKAVVNAYVNLDDIFAAYKQVYQHVGLIQGKRTGKQINYQIKEIESKDFTLNQFISLFERNVIAFLIQSGGLRIRSVRREYVFFINEIIARGLNDNKTMSQVTTDLDRLFRSRRWYRWQSMRIARTETTTAANLAATIASESSNAVMEKVWISSQDARTRRPPESHFDHYDMNGVKVPLAKTFNVSGEELLYPGDPKGSAGNVINCRCTVGQVPKRDSSGNIVRKRPI